MSGREKKAPDVSPGQAGLMRMEALKSLSEKLFSVFSVLPWCIGFLANLNTETRRSRSLHGEIRSLPQTLNGCENACGTPFSGTIGILDWVE